VLSALRRLQPASNIVYRSRGIGIGPLKTPMPEYSTDSKKVIRCGPDKRRPRWIIPVSGREGQLFRTDWDNYYWKDVLAARFDRFAEAARWQLFSGSDHGMYAAHLHCEIPTLVSANGRAVNVWGYASPSHRDNHYFDTLVGCALAASLAGCEVPGNAMLPEVKKERIKASEMQRLRREQRR
jgi:hypothetical protein